MNKWQEYIRLVIILGTYSTELLDEMKFYAYKYCEVSREVFEELALDYGPVVPGQLTPQVLIDWWNWHVLHTASKEQQRLIFEVSNE